MRILLVGPPLGHSGGVAPYLEGLASSLARRGLQVAYAGIGARQEDYDRGLKPRWEHTVTDTGFESFTLRNPPILPIDTSMPLRDTDSPAVKWWTRLIASWRPDLVHVHSFAGWPGWSLSTALNVPTIYSCHEYFAFCQRGTLVNAQDRLCASYPDQSDCAACVAPKSHKRRLLVAKTQAWVGAQGLTTVRYAKHRVNEALPQPRGGDAPDQRPLILQAGIVNDWLSRARRNVEAMNLSRGVLPVSNEVSKILRQMGVHPRLIDVEFIGSPGAEALQRTPLPQLGEEIRLLYHAGFANYKGGHVLLEAMRSLPQSYRLSMIGSGAADYLERLRGQADSRVSFGGRFDRADLNIAMKNAHAVVAPMTGPDTSPQTVLEALAAGRPVVGSRIGGIPDFVQHEFNGLLVNPDDPDELASQLRRLTEPGLLARLASNANLHRSVKDHTDSLIGRYSRILEEPSAIRVDS